MVHRHRRRHHHRRLLDALHCRVCIRLFGLPAEQVPDDESDQGNSGEGEKDGEGDFEICKHFWIIGMLRAPVDPDQDQDLHVSFSTERSRGMAKSIGFDVD